MKHFLFILFVCSLFQLDAALEDYEILSLLNAGEKGKVFLAQKKESGQLVAIKRIFAKEQLQGQFPDEYLDANYSEDGTSLIAQREFSISQQLNHPHILKLEELFTTSDTDGLVHSFLVMEYVPGITLTDTLAGSHTKEQAIQNALDLINALLYAFEKEWIHNDLYGSNIMFDQNHQIKIIDLDSFDRIDDDDERTNIDYLLVVFNTLAEVLAKGGIYSRELEDLMMNTLSHEESSQRISPTSFTFFKEILKNAMVNRI